MYIIKGVDIYSFCDSSILSNKNYNVVKNAGCVRF